MMCLLSIKQMQRRLLLQIHISITHLNACQTNNKDNLNIKTQFCQPLKALDETIFDLDYFSIFIHQTSIAVGLLYQFEARSATERLISVFCIIIMITKSKKELIQVVDKVFGGRITQITNPINFWYSFIPFSSHTGKSGSQILFQLIQLSNQYKISQEIKERNRNKYGNLIHDVQILLVSRDLEKSVYLVTAKENVISLKQYIKIKKEADEKIDEKMIEKVIEFAGKLENHPLSKNISFSVDQIGMLKNQELVLINYQLYFTNFKPKQPSLQKDIKCIIFRLLMANENQIYLPLVYHNALENYSPRIRSLVEKCLQTSDFKVSQMITVASAVEGQNLLQTTITDSFHSSQNQQTVSIRTRDLQEELLPSLPALPEKQVKKSKKKASIFVIIFILMFLIIGAVTLKYLNPRPLVCSDSQYLDSSEKICLNCDSSCTSCQGGASEECISCGQSEYLVKQSKKDRVGRCSISCTGIKIKNNICVMNPEIKGQPAEK